MARWCFGTLPPDGSCGPSRDKLSATHLAETASGWPYAGPTERSEYLKLPRGADCAALETAGSEEEIAFTLSPDGQYLGLRAPDGTLRVLEVNTGRELCAFKETVGLPWRAAFAFIPDSRRLAVPRRDGTVGIWETASRRELWTLKGHIGVVHKLAFSADGQRLAAASELVEKLSASDHAKGPSTRHTHALKLWNLNTGQELQTINRLSTQASSTWCSRRTASG